jgi:hypothetical protein
MLGAGRNWPSQIPSRGEALASYLRSFADPRVHEMIFTRDDPKPFLYRLLQDAF